MTNNDEQPISLRQQVDYSLVVSAIFTIVLGALAIAAPVAATFAVEMVTGILFAFAGISGLWIAWKLRAFPHRVWRFLSPACFLLLALWLLAFPLEGIITLTLLVGCVFIAEGVFRVMYVPPQTPNRTWLLIDGAIGILLGVIVISGWPGDSDWLLGLLVGIRLVVTGFVILMVRKELDAWLNQPRS